MPPQRLTKVIVALCDQTIEGRWKAEYIEDRQVGANRDPGTTRFDFFYRAFREPGFFRRLLLSPVPSQAGFLEPKTECDEAAQGGIADEGIGF